MLDLIHLTIPGEPMAKARPRWAKWGIYTPKKTVNYETQIKERFAAEHPNFELLLGPIALTIKAYLGIPKSVSKKKRLLMEGEKILPTKRPDADNIIKIVMDALQGLTFKNDSQLFNICITKYYSSRPRVEIQLLEVPTSS